MQIIVKEYAVKYTRLSFNGNIFEDVVPCNKTGYVKDADLRRANIAPGFPPVLSRSLPFLKKTRSYIFSPDNIVCLEESTNEEGEKVMVVHTAAGSWVFTYFDTPIPGAAYVANHVSFGSLYAYHYD